MLIHTLHHTPSNVNLMLAIRSVLPILLHGVYLTAYQTRFGPVTGTQ